MFCDFGVENLSDNKSLLLNTIVEEFVFILCTDNMQQLIRLIHPDDLIITGNRYEMNSR